MKKFNLVLFSVCMLWGHISTAQSDEERVINDLLFIADNFARPAADGASYQASAGWFTSAQSLKKWRVEVSFHGNALFVPTSKQNFTVNNNRFSLLRIKDESGGVRVPSAFGGDTDVFFEGEVRGNSFEFQALEGVNKSAVPHAFPQVTVGLPYESELAIRVLPAMTIDGVKFSTYGAGLKHNFSQYFRFNEPEDFQFAAILAYSKFDVEYEFNPVDIPNLANLNVIDVNANLWVASVLGSKRYGDFEVFGALGATNSNFTYEMGGTGVALGAINTALGEIDDAKAQFKGDLGFNFYLNRFKISSMLSAGNFFNANLGLHFRI
ncbi:DUF6588 family protein [Salegentibacter sp. HM20]